MTDAALWTPDAIEARLRAALITLRRVPAGRIFPAGLRVAWPEIVRSYSEAYGWDRAEKPRVQATAEDIRQMDEALGWTARWLNAAECEREGLAPDTARVVMARASGVRWDAIGMWRVEWWGHRPTEGGGRSKIPGGNSYPSLVAIHRAGLGLLAARLNGGRDHLAGVETVEQRGARRLVADVEVSYPVGEEGTYGPVRARARHVVRPAKGGRGG